MSNQEKKVTISFRVPESLRARLEADAKAGHRTLSQHTEMLIMVSMANTELDKQHDIKEAA